jgi:hypothetical protein
MQRETVLLRYIKHMRKKAELLAKNLINENNPDGEVNYEKGKFSLTVVSAPGKTINVNGTKRLAYSNKLHTKLKRSFKIYQKLQN